MKFAKITAAAAVIAMIGGTAMAQDSGAYAGVTVDAFDFDAYGVSVRAGYNFTENFGIEGQLGHGIIDEEVTVGGTNVDVGVNLYGAGFLVGRLPASEQFELIARVGYYVADAEAAAGGVSVSDTEDGFAVGGGAQFNFGEGNANGIRAEYTYLDASGGSLDMFSLGYVRKF